jgi:GNAT superfamily N-acetyltransferase
MIKKFKIFETIVQDSDLTLDPVYELFNEYCNSSSENDVIINFYKDKDIIGKLRLSSKKENGGRKGNYEIVISSMKIEEPFRGKGYSKYFLKQILKELSKFDHPFITLNVISTNEIAINIYKSLGFDWKENVKDYKGWSDDFFWERNKHVTMIKRNF